MIQAYFSRTYYLLYSETRLTLYQLQGQKIVDKADFILAEFDGLPAALAHLRQYYPLKTEDSLIVGLPLRLFNLVKFPLPRAAEENLEEAIGYELTRHVPYELESCLIHTTSVPHEDHLQVSAVLALKEPLRSYLADLSAAGLSATAIVPALLLTAWMSNQDGIYIHCPESSAEFLVYHQQQVVFSTAAEVATEGEDLNFTAPLALIQNYREESDPIRFWHVNEGARRGLSSWLQLLEPVEIDIAVGTVLLPVKTLPYKIDLVSTQMRRKKQLKTWSQIGIGILFILSLSFYPTAYFAGKYTELSNLEEKLNIVQQRAMALDSLRHENQALIERYEKLAAYVHSRPQVVDTLKELTDIISTDTWLVSLQLHDRHLTLRGTAIEATAVIEALTSSPLLQDVHFDSPVVKKGLRETFTIVANLK